MLDNCIDKAWQWLANSVFPERLIYWCFVRGAAIATQQEYSATPPSELDIMTAMQRIDSKTPSQRGDRNE